MRRRVLLSALLMVIVVLGTNQSAVAEKTQLILWSQFSDAGSLGGALARLAERYSEINPDVEVVFEVAPGLPDKLRLGIATGTGPDITTVAELAPIQWTPNMRISRLREGV